MLKYLKIFYILTISFFIIFLLFIFINEAFKPFSDEILSDAREKNLRGIKLAKSGYFKEKLDLNPYDKFSIRFAHPYYMFLTPWKEEIIKLVNNEYVNLDQNGFRVNPYIKKNKTNYNIVLLGGSSAFGMFSSSDKNTLASAISNISNKEKIYISNKEYDHISVVNRNSPAWNSYQELLGLIQYQDNYEASISFSLINDIHLPCLDETARLTGKQKLDTPQHFMKYYFILENSKTTNVIDHKSLKSSIINLLPETHKLFKHIRNKLFESNKEYFMEPKEKHEKCFSLAPKIAKNFIKNQILMKSISNSRNAKHLTVLQPNYAFHPKYNLEYTSFKNRNLYNFTGKVYDLVMLSDYCKSNCVDLRNIFDNINQNGEAIHIDELETQEITNKNLSKLIFYDDVHLLDYGYNLIANNLIKEITR